MRALLLLTSTLLLASCGTGDSVGTSTTAPAAPSASPDGAWVLEGGTVDGAAVPIVAGFRITLTVDGRQLGGTAACNGYGGSIIGDPGVFVFDEIMVTAMACEPTEVMATESLYLEGLHRTTSMARKGDTLELTGEGVRYMYTPLAPVPTSKLLGTEWILETLVMGDVASSVGGDPATLQLRDDGTLTGSTGCRLLSGKYIVTGDEVLFVEFSADGECPAALQSQDNQVVTVLGDGFTVEFEGERMTLTSSGSEGLVYRRG